MYYEDIFHNVLCKLKMSYPHHIFSKFHSKNACLLLFLGIYPLYPHGYPHSC